jgi:hypothetical protein
LLRKTPKVAVSARLSLEARENAMLFVLVPPYCMYDVVWWVSQAHFDWIGAVWYVNQCHIGIGLSF